MAAAARVTAPARRTPQSPRSRPRPRKAPQPPRRKATRAQRLAAIPHSPFVDRLLTGRGWIVLVGLLLAGIVSLNVALLELNAGIAKTSERVSALKRENARLRLQAARLGSTERIQKAAAELGLVLPAPGQVRYLKADAVRDAARALAQMRAPDALVPVTPVPVAVAPAPVVPGPQPVAVAPAAPAPAPAAPAPAPAPAAPVAPVAAAPTTPPPTG